MTAQISPNQPKHIVPATITQHHSSREHYT